MGAQHEILNDEGLVAFEARAGRDGPGLDDALLMNGQIGALGALAPAFARRTLLGQGLAGLLHAARLDLGPPFEPLETGDLVPLGRDGALQLGPLDHERNHQRPEIRKRPRVQISGQSHARNQSEITPAGNPIRPDFRPSYWFSVFVFASLCGPLGQKLAISRARVRAVFRLDAVHDCVLLSLMEETADAPEAAAVPG